MTAKTFMGYVRADGSVGTRNHILVLPSVLCSSVVCERIAEAVENCIAVTHQHGCSQIGADSAQTTRMLKGLGMNPNVAGVLVVSLGCEVVDGEEMAQVIAQSGKPAAFIRIQDVGGSVKAIEAGIKAANAISQQVKALQRESVGIEHLRLAVKWGDGLDGFSGAATDLVELVRDICSAGGGVCMGELEKVMHSVGDTKIPALEQLRQQMTKRQELLINVAEPAMQRVRAYAPTLVAPAYPDVFDMPIASVRQYAEQISGGGLQFMDSPCSDVECISGYAAGGANVALFFSDGGSPVGNPVMPVVKVSTANVDEIWRDHVDYTISSVDGQVDGASLFHHLLKVASGQLTAAELLGHEEFAIHRIGISL